MTTIIEARSVSKSFLENGSTRRPLDELDLTVERGELVTILGRSGKYWIAAVVGTMLLNGIFNFLETGQIPGTGDDEERGDYWKDFFAFRDGTTDADGNPNRHTIPGYLMHDIYGWANHPWRTVTNKLSPFSAFATISTKRGSVSPGRSGRSPR